MRLPKTETLIITAFLGSVLLWGISKCNAKRAQLAASDKEETEDERPAATARRDTTTPILPKPAPAQQPAAAPQTYAQPPGKTPGQTPSRTPQLAPTDPATAPAATAKSPNAAAAPAQKFPTLYVVIDGLKLRKQPGLKGETVGKLELYQPVLFLNQKTEWTQEISLGTEKVTDHWVKIRTQSGKEGWVFGAGVHYYKMKRKGVLE